MADEELRQAVITWSLLGLLSFSLIGFFLTVVSSNNISSLSPEYFNKLNATKNNLNTYFVNSSATADKVLNSTSFTNPEASYLGSKDQVATAYDVAGSAKGSFEQLKLLIGIAFSQNPEYLIFFGGIIIFSFVMLIISFLRIGK